MKQHSKPLSPVALSLPREPQDIRSLPSPARGSAGCRPTPSPAIATAKNPSCWSESGTDYSYDTTGLLAISKAVSGSEDAEVMELTKRAAGRNGMRNSSSSSSSLRTEQKKLKIKKLKARRNGATVLCKNDDERTVKNAVNTYRLNGGPPFYDNVIRNSSGSTVGIIAAATATSSVTTEYIAARVKPTTLVEFSETEVDVAEPQHQILSDELNCKKHQNRKRRAAEMDTLKRGAGGHHRSVVTEVAADKYDVRVKDEQHLAKKLKLEDNEEETCKTTLLLLPPQEVNAQKKDYLSALELCCVKNQNDESKDENHHHNPKEEETFDPMKWSENHAPLRKHEEEKNVKAQLKKTQQQEAETTGCSSQRDKNVVTGKEESSGDSSSLSSKGSSNTSDGAALEQSGTQTDSKKPTRVRKRRWTAKKKNKKKPSKAAKSSEEEKMEAENAEKLRRAELLSLTQKRASSKLKWSNGWTWIGEPFVAKVFLNVSIRVFGVDSSYIRW